MDEFLNRGEKTTEYDFVYSLLDSTVSEFHLNIKLNNELQCLDLCIKSLMYLYHSRPLLTIHTTALICSFITLNIVTVVYLEFHKHCSSAENPCQICS